MRLKQIGIYTGSIGFTSVGSLINLFFVVKTTIKIFLQEKPNLKKFDEVSIYNLN